MIDISFTTTSKSGFLADLEAAGLYVGASQSLATGIALHYEGPRVVTAPTYDAEGVVITPPVYSTCEYAHLRLYGPWARIRFQTLHAAAFSYGTAVDADSGVKAFLDVDQATSLAEIRENLMGAIASHFERRVVGAGHDTGLGWRLRLDEADRNILMLYRGKLRDEMAGGARQSGDPAVVADAEGIPRSMDSAAMVALLDAAASYFEQQWIGMAITRNAIRTAESETVAKAAAEAYLANQQRI